MMDVLVHPLSISEIARRLWRSTADVRCLAARHAGRCRDGQGGV